MKFKKLLVCLLAALQVALPMAARAQAAPQTSISYDAAGRPSAVTSPMGRVKAMQYDALGRQVGESRPNIAPGTAYGPVGMGYNAQDALTSVTDPRGLVTTYGRDGFGQVLSQASPDTGTTGYGYDSNGNLLLRTTAAGQTESYTLGPADRVQTKTVTQGAGGSTTYTFSYGAANAGVEAGRLISIAAPGQQLTFTHDVHGRVSATTQTVTGQSFSVGYGYVPGGKLATLTYPSGRVVTYSRDVTGAVSAVSAAQGGVTVPLLSSVAHTPFGGPVRGWTFGAAGGPATVVRAHDLNGRTTSVTLPTGARQYGYDDDDRIVSTSDAVLGSAVYGYDDLDRLTSASTSIGFWTYDYDATGNRTDLGVSGQGYAVTVESASNRTTASAGPVAQAITFTADGHSGTVAGTSGAPACGGSLTLSYAGDGELTSSNVLSAVMSPFGQRLQKTAAACAGGAVTHFVYDLAGRLIAEYDGSGVLLEETVWLSGLPVAVFTSASPPTAPFYVYADNLGTPRAITNTSGQLVWQWDGEPFGATPANANPSGLGPFTYNFRFPGQYYDLETGYHHNGWREYDPKLGRYIQSDPIGLGGGINTYAYVGGNPLSQADPTGQATGVGSGLLLLDGASLAANIAAGNYVAAAFDGVSLVVDAIPGVPEGVGLTVRAVRSTGAVGKVLKFATGSHEFLLKCKQGLNTQLDSHHIGQKALMKKLIPGYNELHAPAIAVPRAGHSRPGPYGSVSTDLINPRTGKEFDNVRDVLARDVREMRRVYPDVPNSALQNSLERNKAMFSEASK